MNYWLEWLGYLASLIVLISLVMSSIKKLRWINLLGSLLFSVYGFLLGSLPVGFMNLGIALINIYYLFNMYRTEDYFKILPVEPNSQYLNYFFEYYKEDLRKNVDLDEIELDSSHLSFFILRNMVPAGIFLCSSYDDKTLKIEVDYVIPEYRDFKIGEYIFDKKIGIFRSKGFEEFISFTDKPEHINYLKKMGFTNVEDNKYVKSI